MTDATGHVWSDATTAYLADADGVAPFFTPVTQVDASIDNGARSKPEPFTPNMTPTAMSCAEDQVGDISTTTDDRTLIRTFANNTADWLLGFLTSGTVYEGLDSVFRSLRLRSITTARLVAGRPRRTRLPRWGISHVRSAGSTVGPILRLACLCHGNILLPATPMEIPRP